MDDRIRSAIVTGGSRGIGAAIAERLARDGLCVTVNYVGNQQAAEDTVARIEAAGGRAIAVKADVSDPAEVKALFDRTEAEFGGIDVLVNNAGIMTLQTIAETDPDSVDAMIGINFKGCINTMREAANRMRDGGRIVNLSTSVVGTRFERYGVYAAIKAGIETMTGILSKEMRGRQITVNAVAPGPTETELFLKGKSEEFIQKLAMASPLERLGQPEDIANAVAFLVGDEGKWINGQTLRANGGLV
ncbi:SDR family oxidoreductase [Paracoccus sp. 1_MG-2023]|uniref:SDR family oxidoreductase n=1 Tax=unclassified Paracoccus (in: a-proteobacteria) TaxID=2688777 RepID=UPI001C0A41F8|nr:MULTISPECIES: SDR family oxidoreductase [unclassified Paracoccus (in: a-proteobacteria)]MBU2958365.1 SDR family oxidoreductase [Paracoccus sp. C2R09]MDO6670284.1 SDR family oxidoreductase [Paracoccus sp. 1_MG-2023]